MATKAGLVLPDWLARCAGSAPGRMAARCGDETWTFAELDRQASRLARQMASAGVRAGDRVAVLCGNSLVFVALVHALARLGAVLAPLNLRLTAPELAWQIDDVRAAWLVSDPAHSETAAQIAKSNASMRCAVLAAEVSDDAISILALPESDVALRDRIDLSATQAIMYTSGTTGRPKGAIVTFGMQWWNAVGSALNLGHRDDDRWLAVLPFFHIGGLAILWRSVIGSVGVVIHERFDPTAANDSLANDGITLVSVVAVMLQRMLDEREGPLASTLRCALLGGGPAPLPLLQACAQRGIPVVQTYGLTESCSQAFTLAPADALRKLGSAGRPLLPVQARIWHDSGLAAPGVAGEIRLKGPTITPGYFDRPEETAQALQNGWLATGDIGYLDDEGYLYVLDRRSDLIVSGGENVYPAEIEAALLEHPAVVEAGVCGIEDATWGQVPVAIVRLQPGQAAAPGDLATFLAERLARHKLPRSIAIVRDPLPRNAAGKLMRRKLPDLLSPQ
jgi:O-succinylbenzoic acid--CoA ligase